MGEIEDWESRDWSYIFSSATNLLCDYLASHLISVPPFPAQENGIDIYSSL